LEHIEKNETLIDSDFILSSIEKDTIGEIMNISMGSAATAISTMLNRKVSITTPEVILAKSLDYEFSAFEPSVCTEIQYLDGLNGGNFMILKLSDVKAIVSILLNSESSDDDSLDEMHLSAIGEIMNQMMGSSSTSLAQFFGHNISISIPDVYELDRIYDNIKKMGLGDVVIVKFKFSIENAFDSEFVSLLPIEFTKELVEKVLDSTQPSPQVRQPEPAKASVPVEQKKKQDRPVEASPGAVTRKKQVNVQPLQLGSLENDMDNIIDHDTETKSEYTQPSFELIMDVPLEISVEIGHTRKLVKDVLEIRQGSIIELDKQAGDPVDIIVNGQLLAKGDVVVVDDNFGVRITEITSNKHLIQK